MQLPPLFQSRIGRAAPAALALLLLGAGLNCSKSGSTAPAVQVEAPSALAYPITTVSIVVGGTLTIGPTVIGTVDNYSVSPALPAGLTLGATTGVLSGTATVPSPQTTYTVTATNAGGSTTATIQIEVRAPVVVPIYVSGFVTPLGGEQVATTWQNGVPTPLSDGSQNVLATAVAVSGPDTYAVGTDFNFTTGMTEGLLWKNGQKTIIATSSSSLTFDGLAVSGTNVYIVGSVGSGALSVATMWTNGTPAPLNDSGLQSQAKAIVLSGPDVYVAGEVDNKPTYWKDGLETSVVSTTPAVSVAIGGMAVFGTDVYIAGAKIATVGGNSVATLWHLSAATSVVTTSSFTDGSSLAYANSVAVNGAHVYVAVTDGDKASLWTDGIGQALPGSAGVPATADAVVISGNDVYVAGTLGHALTVWTNGTPKAWTDGTSDVHVTGLALASN